MLADYVNDADINGARITSIQKDEGQEQLRVVLTTVQGETVGIVFAKGVLAESPTTYRQLERLPQSHAARHITWWDEPLPNKFLFALESGDVLVIQATNAEVCI